MQQLILMRHGKAAPELDHAHDRDRPLQGRGIEEASLAGQQIAAHLQGGAPGLKFQALVSSARRTRETWQVMDGAFAAPPPRFVDALYMASAQTIWALAQSSAADTCLIIGHNPGLHELVQILLGQAHDHSAPARALMQNFPTSAFAAFALSGEVLEAAGPRLLACNAG